LKFKKFKKNDIFSMSEFLGQEFAKQIFLKVIDLSLLNKVSWVKSFLDGPPLSHVHIVVKGLRQHAQQDPTLLTNNAKS
jgi:hypothetical protein